MDNKTYDTLILPKDDEMSLESGKEILWMKR